MEHNDRYHAHYFDGIIGILKQTRGVRAERGQILMDLVGHYNSLIKVLGKSDGLLKSGAMLKSIEMAYACLIGSTDLRKEMAKRFFSVQDFTDISYKDRSKFVGGHHDIGK